MSLRNLAFFALAVFFGVRAVGRIHDAWTSPEWDGFAAVSVFLSLGILVLSLKVMDAVIDKALRR